MIFKCPICKGPIAMWAVREAFTCHHCRWALTSNLHRTIGRAVGVGCVAALLLIGGLWLGLGSMGRALDAWIWASGGFGFLVGSGYVHWALHLVPLRPQRQPAKVGLWG